jgi:hypothetical protein
MASTPPHWGHEVISPDAPGSGEDWWRPSPAPPASPPAPSVPRLGAPASPDVAVAGGLLLLSVGLYIAAMFPAYAGNPAVSVVSTPYELAEFICLALGWTAAAVLVLSRLSVRGGVALAAGIAPVELGFLIADLAGTVQGPAGPTPGIWLAFAALGMGGAGILLGASTVPMGSPRLRPYNQSLHPRALVTTLVALLAVAAFLPSWDRYEVVNSAGQTLTVTLGNAFAQPAGIMAGELVAAFAIGVIAILGAFWAPPSVGAWMTGGALVALTAQLISAVVQVNQPLSVTIAGQRATVSLTGYWAIDVGAAVALAALTTWAGLAARPIPGQLGSRPLAPGQSPGSSPLEQRPPAGQWPGIS